MTGKKWCEYCRINLPFDKKVIQDHQSTRKHIHNKQKYIKYQRFKLQQQQKAAKAAIKVNTLMSTTNIPKAKKGSQLEQRVEMYRNAVIDNGKMAIHQLIAEKTKGLYGAPIQYPNKQDLLLAENYIENKELSNVGEDDGDQKQQFEMWKINVCEETGKACFINRITQAKVYEPPVGYIMSEEQKQQWEDTKKICDQIPDQNNQQIGKPGQWQQAEEQNYFDLHRANDQQPTQSSKIALIPIIAFTHQQQQLNEQPTTKFQSISPKLQTQQLHNVQNTELNQQQIAEQYLTRTLQSCRTIKQKNEIYKKLVRNNYQIKNTTLGINDQYLTQQQQDKKNKNIVFIKPRKKVKIAKILQDQDIF